MVSTPHQWEKIAVFAFGVIFISILLALVLLFPHLSPEAYTVFRIIIALAAAGIGAVIPGILDVEMKGLLRAGGAMALFVIVYFFSPAPPTPVIDPPVVVQNPAEPPDRTITEWFALVDKGDYFKAWPTLSNVSLASYDQAAFVDVFEKQRKPLGPVLKRNLYGLQALTTLPNGSKGNFRLYTYRTTFSSGKEFLEAILLIAEDNKWKVRDHNIGPAPNNLP